MSTVNTGNGLKVRAHKDDAMTLLAFDLAENKSQNFTGFTARVTAGTRAPYYMTNLLKDPAAILKKNNIRQITVRIDSAFRRFRSLHGFGGRGGGAGTLTGSGLKKRIEKVPPKAVIGRRHKVA